MAAAAKEAGPSGCSGSSRRCCRRRTSGRGSASWKKITDDEPVLLRSLAGVSASIAPGNAGVVSVSRQTHGM